MLESWVTAFSNRPAGLFGKRHRWGLPVLAREVSMHAWDLRLRGVKRMLAVRHPPMLPSAMRNGVGTLVAIISQLNTPACTSPCQHFDGSLAAGHA
jgi:hypothetical protein